MGAPLPREWLQWHQRRAAALRGRWIDLTAGPLLYGPHTSGEGLISEFSLPRLDNFQVCLRPLNPSPRGIQYSLSLSLSLFPGINLEVSLDDFLGP